MDGRTNGRTLLVVKSLLRLITFRVLEALFRERWKNEMKISVSYHIPSTKIDSPKLSLIFDDSVQIEQTIFSIMTELDEPIITEPQHTCLIVGARLLHVWWYVMV